MARRRKKKEEERTVAMVLPTTMTLTSQLADVLSWLRETDNPEEQEEYQGYVTEMTTILEKKGDDVIKSLNFKGKEVNNFKEAKAELDTAFKRLEKEQDSYKRYLRDALAMLENPTIKSKLGTLYLTTKDKLVITKPEDIPDDFKYREFTIRIPEKDWNEFDWEEYLEYKAGNVKGCINTTALKEYLTDGSGNVLQCAHIEQTKSLGMRKPTKAKAKEAEKIK